MNRDQIKGTWGQLRGRLKRAWGELTENDDLKAEGSVDRLYGKLQKNFGDAKEGVKRRLNHIRFP